MFAAKRGHVNVVKTLIERKADVNMLTEVIMYIMCVMYCAVATTIHLSEVALSGLYARV